MECARCGIEFELPVDNGRTNVCGSCADDLRADTEAEILMMQASDEELARQEYEDAERRAYEAQGQST